MNPEKKLPRVQLNESFTQITGDLKLGEEYVVEKNPVIRSRVVRDPEDGELYLETSFIEPAGGEEETLP